MTHLQQLESESIHIMREVVAETANSVLQYSIDHDAAASMEKKKQEGYF
jgi:sulfate adenylyltransferase subunit 2